jgi:hypothetical protein
MLAVESTWCVLSIGHIFVSTESPRRAKMADEEEKLRGASFFLASTPQFLSAKFLELLR